MKKLMATALTLMMLAGTFAPTTLSAEGSGWKKDGNDWYYMDANGKMATGWLATGSGWYYMDADGIMQIGWQEIGGRKYYFETENKNKGKMVTGAKIIDGKTELFKMDGSHHETPYIKAPSGFPKLDNYLEEIYQNILKPDMGEREQLWAIYNYMADRLSYDLNAEADNSFIEDLLSIYRPLSIENRRLRQKYEAGVRGLVATKGKCTYYMGGAMLLARALGYETKGVLGETGGIRHAWNAIRLSDGSWKMFDATLGKYDRNKYFMFSENKMPDNLIFFEYPTYVSDAEYEETEEIGKPDFKFIKSKEELIKKAVDNFADGKRYVNEYVLFDGGNEEIKVADIYDGINKEITKIIKKFHGKDYEINLDLGYPKDYVLVRRGNPFDFKRVYFRIKV